MEGAVCILQIVLDATCEMQSILVQTTPYPPSKYDAHLLKAETSGGRDVPHHDRHHRSACEVHLAA